MLLFSNRELRRALSGCCLHFAIDQSVITLTSINREQADLWSSETLTMSVVNMKLIHRKNFSSHCISNSVCKTRKKKAFTGSDVDRVVAVAIGLVPYSSKWTGMLATCGKHRDWVPVSALDVLGRVIVWEVVAERHYVVVGTRTGQAAAELSDCNQYIQISSKLSTV